MVSRRSLVAGSASLLVAAAPLPDDDADAQQVPPARLIRFGRNTSSAEVSSSVVRGERDLYLLKARAGQHAWMRITALENNAVFDLYQPGAQPSIEDHALEVAGTPLPGAETGADAKAWTGRLPVSGAYLIVVGGTRGNATYRLTVTVR